MPIPSSVIDALLEDDDPPLVNLGQGKYVFADHVEDARPLEPHQVARLSQCQPSEDAVRQPPLAIVQLNGGDIIPSSIGARAIEIMVGRSLPSARGSGAGRWSS